MALRIIKSDDPIQINQLVIVNYGAPGLGKSTLGFTADNPLLLDFDRGAHRAANRKDSVPVDSWGDAATITPEDLKPYDTVVVDTTGRALDYLTADIIKRNPKMGRGGALTLQGYGALKAEFTAWLKSLKVIGKDVVLLAHSSEEKNGDDIIERLDVQGGSKGEIYKSADAMGRLYLANGKRTLSFSPTDTAFGKNPGNLSPVSVEDVATNPSTLSEVIQSIKDNINQLTEEQKRRQAIIADWKAKIQEAQTPDDFNQMVPDVKKADKEILSIIKGELHKTAKAQGFVYDKSNGYMEATG